MNKPLTPEQKEAKRLYSKQYQLLNKEKIKAYKENYYKDNKNHIKEYNLNNKDKIKQWVNDNRTIINKQNSDRSKNRYLNDIEYRLKINISNLIRKSLKQNGIKKDNKKNSKTKNILGCSFIEFKTYIESMFEPWMTWQNKGLYNGELNFGWDLDHIKPISKAKSIEDIIILNHYTNFQPLCSKINIDIKKAN